jgi:hypothetical protein
MVVAMTDKPLTPEQIIIAEWRAKDAALVEAVEEVTIDWKAIAQAHNDSLVERIAENEKAERMAAVLAERIKDYRAENERLRSCLRFFASVIKSGEPWTITCEKEYRAALTDIRVGESALSAEVGNQIECICWMDVQSKDCPVHGPGSATYNERWKSKP